MLRPIGFIEPCLPTGSRTAPIGPQWVYEIKHDGFRFICWRAGDRVRVFSRQGIDWTDRVPLIVGALQALRVKSVVVDGEGVVCPRWRLGLRLAAGRQPEGVPVRFRSARA